MANCNFLHSKELIEEGDTAIVYVNYGSTCPITVKRGMTLSMKYGALKHEYLIGKRYGRRISATAGYVYVLRPSPELWTLSLSHRTQILYSPDISLICCLLDLKPGFRVIESGTGSASLSQAIGRTIAPNGRLYSFDIDECRAMAARADLSRHGLGHIVQVNRADVCVSPLLQPTDHSVDAIFLDLPCPWLAIEQMWPKLKMDGGRLVAFSPCVEQAQRSSAVLRQHNFVQIETVQLVPRCYKVVDLEQHSLQQFASMGPKQREGVARPKTAIPFPMQQPTHTGYLTSATLLHLAA